MKIEKNATVEFVNYNDGRYIFAIDIPQIATPANPVEFFVEGGGGVAIDPNDFDIVVGQVKHEMIVKIDDVANPIVSTAGKMYLKVL